MARRKKGSDFDLAKIETFCALTGAALLCLYLMDPTNGRAFFKFGPSLVLTIAVVGGAIYLALALVSRTSTQTAPVDEDLCDLAGRLRSPSPASAPPVFPKVEADFQRERVLSLEEKLDRIDWFQFEKVVAMLYSSRGCQVERRGGANPDGGIDIVVDSGEERFAIQCKFWKTSEVGVRQVRELIGALQDARIPTGVIVSIKGFTDQAKELAARHNIQLIDKSALIQMLNEARFSPHVRELNAVLDSKDKYCPRCERAMTLRTSSKDCSKFWGCSGYPRCRFTMKVREEELE